MSSCGCPPTPEMPCPGCGSMYAPPECGACGTIADPVTGVVVPRPGVCAPGPGNARLPSAEYQHSLGVCLQDVVDNARRLRHEFGVRPYRVRMVWMRRNRHQRFTEMVREIELMPATLTSLTGVQWVSTYNGMTNEGSVQISDISPTQVDYDTLQGKIDGHDPEPDVEFWYEIEKMPRCVGDPPSEAGRYTPASVPYFDGEMFGWVISVTAQQTNRAAESIPTAPDRDQTFAPGLRRPSRNGILRI